MLTCSLIGPHRQYKHENVGFEYLLYLAGFLKTCLNGDCCENFHRELAVLVVSSSGSYPEPTAHGVAREQDSMSVPWW